MDIQMIKCIPSPEHLKVFVQHHEKLACVRCRYSADINCSQIPTEGCYVSIRQAQDFVMKSVNDSLPLCLQLGVDCVDVRFAEWGSSKINLAKHVEAPRPMA